MNKIDRILAFLFCCLLCQMAQPARAQLEGKIIYPKFYTYHAGDDTTWAQPEFDDRDWEQIQHGTFPRDRRPGIGWFRYILEVDSTLWNVPLGLSMRAVGAVEFYLDGVLLHRFGKVATSKEQEEPILTFDNPHVKVIAFHPFSNTVGSKSRHLLAFRYSDFFRQSPVWSGYDDARFLWNISDLDRMHTQRDNLGRKVTLHQMFLTGVCLAFGLGHFLLFLFYPRTRANLYYAALAVSFALLVYFWFQRGFVTPLAHWGWVERLRVAAWTLTTLSLIRLVYSLMYSRLPKTFVSFFLIGLGVTLWYWFRPIIAGPYLFLFYLVGWAETIRVLVVFRIKKRQALLEESWIILLGLIPFSLVVVYYLLALLPDVVPLPWEFEDFPAPFYAVLLPMISMSVFLARNFARTEAENARKTKELEEARQLQLSMLPQDFPRLPHLEIAVYSKPAAEVGGDYYDFHLDDDGTLTIAIGDATGHGMKAGAMVSIAKGLFKALAHEAALPQIFHKMSGALKSMNLSYMYMAMTLVRCKDNHLRIAVAGMPPALLYKAKTNQVDEIALKGMPLGEFPNFPYQQVETELAFGDALVLMSDGLPEMFNARGEILDYPGAKKLVEEVAHESPQAIIDYMVAAGEKWANGRPQEDDVTFVVMKVTQSARLAGV
ncbi:SpoIIE family protein phosphatase [candidate division KSB1 bacterium]|nr:SpoIIE family protein phosphatase [candidate division KSB1 bacterium]